MPLSWRSVDGRATLPRSRVYVYCIDTRLKFVEMKSGGTVTRLRTEWVGVPNIYIRKYLMGESGLLQLVSFDILVAAQQIDGQESIFFVGDDIAA